MDAMPTLRLQAGLLHKVHTDGHTIPPTMGKSKLALSLDAGLVAQMDALVRKGEHPSRSAAVEAAIRGYLRQAKEQRYDAMLDLLQVDEEQALADERFQADVV